MRNRVFDQEEVNFLRTKLRKVVLDLAVSLDGFIEGTNGETDWCIMDEEMGFTKFLNSIDAIIYGRKSYELWGEYLPGDDASEMEKEILGLIHSKKKYVVSKTRTFKGHHVVTINDNIEEEVNKIKAEPGKDIWLYGGASLITTFVNLGLVDEYRISVHPIILGGGKPLFVDILQRQELELVDTKRFTSGVVQLCYRHIRK